MRGGELFELFGEPESSVLLCAEGAAGGVGADEDSG